MARRSRRVVATLSAGLIVAALGGCGGNDDTPTSSSGESSTTPTSQSPEPTEPQPSHQTGPLAGYTEDEVDAYRDAASAWRHAIAVAGRILARGKADPAARRQLAEIYAPSQLSDAWADLQEVDQSGVEINGFPRVLRVEPIRVLVNDTDGSIDLRSCVDPSQAQTGAATETTANRLNIKLDLDESGRWLITDIDDVGDCSTGVRT